MNTDKNVAERIASEYVVKEESKVVALKKLDIKAKRPSNIFAYTFGTISTLVLGTGMSLAMRVIGEGEVAFIVGIVIGLLGLVGVTINYPIYKKLLAKSKAKYAPDIIALAKSISEE